jgi:DNA polymerase-3 subunit delta'
VAFPRIVGHLAARRALARATAAGRLPSGLLLTGPSGIGKRALAIELARALVCLGDGERPCEACSHCRRILHGLEAVGETRERAVQEESPVLLNHYLHPDVLLVEPWRGAARPAIRVEQVRHLIEQVQSRPFESRARAIVIDDAHWMTAEGANALLKSLEEPPSPTHFVLVTDRPEQLPQTIRSRCQRLRLGPLPRATLEAYLREHAGLSPAEARRRAGLAGGSVGAALELDAEGGSERRDELLALLEAAGSMGALERQQAAQKLDQAGDLPGSLLLLRSLLRDVAALRAGAPEVVAHLDVAERLSVLAAGPLGARAGRAAEALAERMEAVMGNAYGPLACEVIVDCIVA